MSGTGCCSWRTASSLRKARRRKSSNDPNKIERRPSLGRSWGKSVGVRASARKVWKVLENRPLVRSTIAIASLLALAGLLLASLAEVKLISLGFMADNASFLLVLALTLNTLGYQAEVFRAGFQSVSQTQIDGAKAIGMRPRQVFAHITLPQGTRLITLPLLNEWLSLFKASALLGIVAVSELNWAAGYLGNNRSHPIEAYIMVSAVYLAIIIPLGKAVGYWERRHRTPGLGTAEPTPAGRGARPRSLTL